MVEKEPAKWDDFVHSIVLELDAMDKRDRDLFRKLSDWMASRQPENRIVPDPNHKTKAVKYQEGRAAFSFAVKDDHIIVEAMPNAPERFGDVAKAKRRMGEHIAQAIRDPNWVYQPDNGRPTVTTNRGPIYPV